MPARPSRKPRESNQDAVRGARAVAGSGKGKGDDARTSATKARRPLADAKHLVGSARGR